MDRCAILVDAGYLLGAAGTLLAGDPDRNALEVDHASLVEALIREAQEQTGMPVLRLLWYDGAFNSQPRSEHRVLRILPDVKVRLGEMVVRAGRVQQKGVDSYLRDLTTLARNQAVADVVLLGGDEDLRRALEEAQDYGIRVHLWGVEAAAPEYNQSQSLIAEADRRWVIPAAWVKQHVQLRALTREAPPAAPAEIVPPVPPVPADEVTPDEVVVAEGAEAGAEAAARPTASREELEHLVATFGRGAPARDIDDGRAWTVTEASHDDVPRLKEITTPAEAWRDNEENATAPVSSAAGAGEIFGARWASRATPEQHAALVALRPRAPRHLDGELLRFAESLGVETWEDEAAKLAVRAGFWRSVTATTAHRSP